RSEPYATLSLSVSGMNCPACAQRVEAVLSECPGVHEAIVNFDTARAEVTLDLMEAGPENLKAAAASIGYGLQETQEMEAPMTPTGLPAKLKPYLVGTIAALSVVGFYLGLLTLTSDFYNAWMEFKAYAGWILALAAGLGVQATLFILLRKKLGGKRMKSAKCSLAASGGMSTSAMAACCSHYLVTLLPVLGLPFLSAAAAGLARYQTYFFLVGVLSSLFGIGLMLGTMKKNGLFFAGALEIEPRLKARISK
ncbi:MAG: cation transporter, partial [Desulfobacterales bacterium]|nr:cation transporter [Desulfobacterales bacterium]